MRTRRVRGVGAAALSALLVLAAVAGAVPTANAVSIDPSKAQFVAGEVGDATCNVEDVQSANEHQLHEILAELTNTTYFRLFQVDLNRPCKFWNKPDAEADAEEAQTCSAAPSDVSADAGGFADAGAAGGLRRARAGAADDVRLGPGLRPVRVRREVGRGPHHAGGHHHLDARARGAEESALEDHASARRIGPSSGWTCARAAATARRERRRGARQPAAQPRGLDGVQREPRLEAIYHENCSAVSDPDDMCYEERVLYRLLSGMHASVNVHVAPRRSPAAEHARARGVEP